MKRALCFALLWAVGCDLPVERAPGTGPVVLETQPPTGAVDVDRAGPFRVTFDRPVFPRDVHRGRVRLQSGSQSAFLSPWFEPVERVLALDVIGAPLEPNVRYRLLVEQVRDLGLVPMADPLEVVFDTGPDAVGETPASVTYGDVAELLGRCSSDACHGGSDPSLGLDLSSGEGIRATAIDVVAVGSRIGTQTDDPWHGASTLDGLARIDVVGGVGRPAQSYLVYELLEEGGAGHAAALEEPPSREEILTLSRWIRAGAPTE
ncbi:MAG: Ig-like domain-containing protein [Sandaracinaceae bacterium]|nr:Ig-like domain-containing protein [Sandaracinaceae bacterium]